MLARPDAHRDEDEADVFRIKDLRGARQVNQQISDGGLEQKERRAHVTENLRAPGFADEIVMLEYAAMRLKVRAGLKRDDEMFVA